MQLRVTDGTTTVDLSGGTTGISGSTYFPLGPSATEASVAEQAELVVHLIKQLQLDRRGAVA